MSRTGSAVRVEPVDFHKATSGLTRLVIYGHSGFITFEAQRWLHDAKVSVIHIDTDGTLLTSDGRGSDNPALRRAQALAATNQTGIEVSRYLMSLKVVGQRRVADRLTGDLNEIDLALAVIQEADSLDEIRQAEMQAAVAYWQGWSRVEMQFVGADQDRIPDHWPTFGQRRSTQSASGRRAVNPANAILNYLYTLLYGEASLALRAVGLDPGLGVVHLDKYARDSLALDLMEAARPQVEEYVLDLIEGHRFRVKDFHETRSGGTRISKSLAHTLSETATTWRNHLAQPAETITKLLARNTDVDVKHLTTPLTQSNRRHAKRALWAPSTEKTRIPNNCQQCGDPLDSPGKLCGQCWDDFQDKSEWVGGRARKARCHANGRTRPCSRWRSCTQAWEQEPPTTTRSRRVEYQQTSDRTTGSSKTRFFLRSSPSA